MTYKRVSSNGSRGSFCRGFRLSPRRVCVLRLRKRLAFFLRLLERCRVSYARALKVFVKMLHRRRRSSFKRNNSSRRSLVTEEQIKGRADCSRLRSFARSNSFYSEAIADCLEFIKRTSISMDQIQEPVSHIQE